MKVPIQFKYKQFQGFLKNELLIMVLIIILGLVSRIPFRTEYLYHWDSVNFAYGMADFNLELEQPHPPGYLLYIFLADGVNWLLNDPGSSLVWIAIFASVFSLYIIYRLGSCMFNQAAGLLAAGLLFSSPLYWFYGEIALPHTLDALLVLLCVWGLYRVWKEDLRLIYPTTIMLSLAGGFRPQTLVFLLPLTLLVFARAGFKRLLLAGLLGAALCLAWFVPLVQLSGGVSEYLRIMGAYSDRFQQTTSVLMGAGLSGVIYNLKKLIPYTLFGMGSGLFGLIFWIFYLIRNKVKIFSRQSIFFGLWIFPVLLYYSFIHMGQQGLIFVFLPALCLIAAFGLERFFSEKKNLFIVISIGVVLVNLVIFLFLPEYPLGPDSQRLLTRDTLRNSDAYFSARFKYIQNEFDPDNTLIVAENWRHAEFYLPEFTILRVKETYFDNPQDGGRVGLVYNTDESFFQPENGQEVIVLVFEPWQGQLIDTPNGIVIRRLADDTQIGLVTLKGNDRLYLKWDFTQKLNTH